MSPSRSSRAILPKAWSSRIESVLHELTAQQFMPRLWAKDPSLWSAEPAEQQRIQQRLGWLSIVPVMESQLAHIQTAAQEIRQAGFTHALLLGMGGSSLFAEVCRQTLGVGSGWLDLTVLDSTDPTAIALVRRRLPLETTLLIVASKSGTTIEVNALCAYFYEQLRAIRGEHAGRQCIAITDVGTPLEAQAKRLGFRQLFAHGPASGQDVGGRFSAPTFFGLVPAALMGMDLLRLVASAKAMIVACQPQVPLANNPAAQLGAFLACAASEGRDKVTLVFGPGLSRVGTWTEQLLAESTGKAGRGLIPIHGEALQDAARYGHDRVFVELQVLDELDARLAQGVDALASAGQPAMRLRWSDHYELGGEAVRWFLATAIASSLMRLNPFDEPDVQASKDRTTVLLDHAARQGSLPKDEPMLIEKHLAIFGDSRKRAGDTIADLLHAFFQQRAPGDYLAILSFLPRTEALDSAIESLRVQLADALGAATMLGIGPRYLHSIGQLHKGGPNTGLFLLLTADDPVDLPVPGQPYSFRVLKHAQALGDFQALKERGRRLLRIHLGSRPDAGIRSLQELLTKALTRPGTHAASRP